ncbi:MAG: hypothetical protein ACKOXP_06085 [Flavobacteriales bacterium]
MRAIVKKRSPLNAANAKKMEALCAWIQENHQHTLGWSQLTQKSGFTKEQLLELFQLYKQVTPLAFIRHVRLQAKQAENSQPTLFKNVDLDHPDKDLFV